MFKMSKSSQGFTLAELLIALAILGVIATFTIPKILSSSTNGQNTAIAKEAASMISGAHQSYTMQSGSVSGLTAAVLTPFMNYVSVDTSTAFTAGGSQLGTALATCSAALPCLKLHNGGVMQYDTVQTFGSTTPAISIMVDPDGPGVQGKVEFVLYQTGRLTTGQNASPAPTHGAAGTISTQATDPTYIANWN